MKFLVALFVFGAIVHAEDVQFSGQSLAYGYIQNIGIPEAERIREAEKLGASRIIGGVPAALGQYPFQAGILGDVTVAGNPATSVCGGSLISASRVLTAAHCWFDGQVQAWRLTVVLGSVLLFSGGTRIQTSAVATHPNFSPALARNDVAVVYFSNSVSLSANIAPVALPSGSQLFESFVGERAIAVGFGVTSNDWCNIFPPRTWLRQQYAKCLRPCHIVYGLHQPSHLINNIKINNKNLVLFLIEFYCS
ncbi:unnamed protein product [Spodoptera exigua]|nr:unnamed protein product [Spodoptera exigua]